MAARNLIHRVLCLTPVAVWLSILLTGSSPGVAAGSAGNSTPVSYPSNGLTAGDTQGAVAAAQPDNLDSDLEATQHGLSADLDFGGNELMSYDAVYDDDGEASTDEQHQETRNITSPDYDDRVLVIGAPLPAPLTPAASDHSTRRQHRSWGNKDLSPKAPMRVQKCCPIGQVALASSGPVLSASAAAVERSERDVIDGSHQAFEHDAATTGADGSNSQFFCMPRSDALDPYWDWLGDVLPAGPTMPSSFDNDEADRFLDLERPKSEALDVTYGVPTCRYYGVLYPGLFPSQEFFVSVDGYLGKKSRHVQPPATYCIDKFVLSENVTSTVRGAIICSESSWLPPASLVNTHGPSIAESTSATSNASVEANDDKELKGGQQPPRATPKCCGPNQMLAPGESRCVDVSTSNGAVPRADPEFLPVITDSADGRPLPIASDTWEGSNGSGGHHQRLAVTYDVLAQSFGGGEKCGSMESASQAVHHFYLLETGHLYFPGSAVDERAVISGNDTGKSDTSEHEGILISLVDPSAFCIDNELADAQDKGNGGDDLEATVSASTEVKDKPRYAALVCHSRQIDPADNEYNSEVASQLVRGTVAEQWRRYKEECSAEGVSAVCIPKCCPFGQLWGRDAEGVPLCVPAPTDAESVWRPTFYQDDGGGFHEADMADGLKVIDAVGPLCPEGAPPHAIPQIPAHDPNQTFYVLTSGQLHSAMYSMRLSSPNYCVDRIIQGDVIRDIALLCGPVPETATVRTLFAAFLITSCVFLALTSLLAFLLPDSSRLATWTLLSYVASLLVAMVILAMLQITRSAVPETPCIAVACVMYYAFLAAFLWLNVMSFDIWHTLSKCSGGQKREDSLWVEMFPGTSDQASTENGALYGRFDEDDPASDESTPMKPTAVGDERSLPSASRSGSSQVVKYMKRCLYAFGIPLFMTGLLLIFQYAPSVPQSFLKTPINPDERCWLNNDWAILFYFYGPIAIILTANLVFFAMTVQFLISHRRSTKNLRVRESQKQRLGLFVKLFVVMGVGWITEIVSWKVKAKEYFYATDAVNALTGIFVFLIFICRRKPLRDLRNKLRSCLCCCNGDPSPNNIGSSLMPPAGSGTQQIAVKTSGISGSSSSSASRNKKPTSTSVTATTNEDGRCSDFLAVIFRNKRKSYTPRHDVATKNGGAYYSRASDVGTATPSSSITGDPAAVDGKSVQRQLVSIKRVEDDAGLHGC